MGRLCCRRFAVCDSPACGERALADLAQSYPDIMVPRERREEMARVIAAAEALITNKIRWL